MNQSTAIHHPNEDGKTACGLSLSVNTKMNLATNWTRVTCRICLYHVPGRRKGETVASALARYVHTEPNFHRKSLAAIFKSVPIERADRTGTDP